MKAVAIRVFAVLTVGLISLTGCSQTYDPASSDATPAESVQKVTQTTGMNCVTPPLDLTNWWPGNGNARDIVGGNHGTLHNGVTFGPGIVVKAFHLDGVDDWVSVADFDTLDGAPNATFEFWVKMNAIPTDPRCNSGSCGIVLFSKNDFVFAVGIHSSLKIEVSRGNSSSWNGDFTLSNGTLTGLGQWNHVAVVVEGATDRIYLNGVLDTTSPQVESAFANFGGLVLGAGFSGDYIFLNADLDEVSIYERALTPEEIQAIYSAAHGKCRFVTICHKPGTPAQRTLIIPVQALEAHLAHGDTMGPCE